MNNKLIKINNIYNIKIVLIIAPRRPPNHSMGVAKHATNNVTSVTPSLPSSHLVDMQLISEDMFSSWI